MSVEAEDIVNLQLRIIELERKVDHLIRHATELPPVPPPSTDLSPAVMEFVHAGDMIGAIKAYRRETGEGLAVAKAAVERALGT